MASPVHSSVQFSKNDSVVPSCRSRLLYLVGCHPYDVVLNLVLPQSYLSLDSTVFRVHLSDVLLALYYVDQLPSDTVQRIT